MRRPLSVARGGLAAAAAAAATAAAALLLLTACGGSGDEDSTASSASSTTASTTPEETGSAAASPFCTEAGGLLAGLAPVLIDQADPPSLAPLLQDTAQRAQAVAPPAELAGDWTAVVDGVGRLAAVYAAVDVNDPQSLQTFQQQSAQIFGELTGSATNVQAYLATECGVTAPTAAPTS
jgi:hypothetical protein